MKKSTDEMFTQLNNDKVKITICGNLISYNRCSVLLELAVDGTRVEVRESANTDADTLNTILTTAYDKFYSVINKGNKKMLAPQITHEKLSSDVDDEIPF